MCESIFHIADGVISPWSFDSVRAKLRAGDDDFDWLSSYHARCFYANYKANADQLEAGYLKSTLLIQVRCQWFSKFVLCPQCFTGLQSHFYIPFLGKGCS